jgi:hypothetical protein
MTKIIGTTHNVLDGNSPGELIFTRSQELPQDYLDAIKAARDASTSGPIADFMYVGSIPGVVVEQWISEGFDFENAAFAEIIRKLKTDGLDGLIATNRRV